MCQVIETALVVERTVNGRAFKVNNPGYREIGVIQVDGCLINDNSRRVDWMVRLPEKKRLKQGTASLKLVELKGSDVMYAFTQMDATLRHPVLADELHLVDEAFIVSQQKPSLVSSIQIEKLEFYRRHKLMVQVVPLAKIDAAYATD